MTRPAFGPVFLFAWHTFRPISRSGGRERGYMLHTISGRDLGMQLHANPERPAEQYFRRPSGVHHGTKPGGGLWTSTLVDERESAFLRWSFDQKFSRDGYWWFDPFDEFNARMSGPLYLPHLWALRPRDDARVLVIRDADDLLRVYRAFPGPTGSSLDFVGMLEQGYDALHVTHEGAGVTVKDGDYRLPETYIFLSTQSWETESTVWLRWSFDEVIDLGHSHHPCHDEWVARGLARHPEFQRELVAA